MNRVRQKNLMFKSPNYSYLFSLKNIIFTN